MSAAGLPVTPMARARCLFVSGLFVSGLLASGCSDRQLSAIVVAESVAFDNKIAVEGRICTEDPDSLTFPLKVLFIIDTSGSMNGNDPRRTIPDPALGESGAVDPTQETGRSRALKGVIGSFIDLAIEVPPVFCNTGEPLCDRDSSSCPACASLGTQTRCLGPACCPASTCRTPGCPECRRLPLCPTPGVTNGSCLPLCDTKKAGCGPGETPCPDCPNATSQCLSGICSKLLDPGVEFAVMRFGAAKQVITRDANGVPSFTNDPSELVTALPQVNNGSSVTDYEGALELAFSLLAEDMNQIQKNNSGALARSKYVVVFLSDGQPDPTILGARDWDNIAPELRRDLIGDRDPALVEQYNVPERLFTAVNNITSLKLVYGAGDVRFHTAYLTNKTTDLPSQELAISLLKQMARIGKGTFRNFRNGESINFLDVDFSSLRRVFGLKRLIAHNTNAQPGLLLPTTDSDGDGLDDTTEAAAGTNRYIADSDGDGFSDGVEYFFRGSGADPLDPGDADCALAENDVDGDKEPDDSDGDGLKDCEERFLGSNRNLFDSDGDGIPDGLEVRFGTNVAGDDREEDLDFDNLGNADELLAHTDPARNDAQHRSRISYRYDIQQDGSGIERIPTPCTDDTMCARSTSQCVQGFCRCATASDCASGAACSDETPCTAPGERCKSGTCQNDARCEVLDASVLGSGQEAQLTCFVESHISCFTYRIENISLSSPQSPDSQNDGWNRIEFYFGQAPFDNPLDPGIFRQTCVNARYNETNGAKSPASGLIKIPASAWRDPSTLSSDPEGGHCVCPDGSFGACTTK